MDLSEQTQKEDIREIEGIIDVQKANGSYRQVAFSLPPQPSETESAESAGAGAGAARSQESGLWRPARARPASLSTNKKKLKLRPKRRKSPLPDVVSWPSDSDVTVLRMQLCRAGGERQAVGDHSRRADGCSMVNLATLVLQSREPSKRSLNIEEFLLPLTSWEHPSPLDLRRDSPFVASVERKVFGANCSHSPPYRPEKLTARDSESGVTRASAKSKVARFLRLYFCPCCTCLYDMEKMREDPSEYAAPPPHRPHSTYSPHSPHPPHSPPQSPHSPHPPHSPPQSPPHSPHSPRAH